MKRKLSSSLTIIFKVLLPYSWIAVWGIIVVGLFFDGGERAALKYMFLAAWIAGVALFYFSGAMNLKEVEIDREFIYVSNYLKQVTVPVSNVYFVTEKRWLNIRPVTIHFRTATEFGERISFMPKGGGFPYSGANTVVNELRALPGVEQWGEQI